jgi:lysophospholipase L1-like esterase
MRRLTRGAAFAALAVAGVGLGSAALLAGEVWWAARGAKMLEPPAPPQDSAAGPPAGAGIPVATVVWLGDSTAAGVGAGLPDATLPEQVAALLAQPVRLTVVARSGARVADVLRRQLPQIARLQPTVVYVSVGANDATHLTSRSHFRRDYERLVAGLPPSVQHVVLLGVPDLGAPPLLAQPLRAVAGWRGRALATDVRNLARRHHAVYVDIAGATGAAFRAHPGTYFASDHFHPSAAGYQLWATVIVAAVHAAA